MSAEMASSLLVHGLPWAAVGAAGGLAFGIGLGGRARAVRGLLGGLLGAIAGAFLYEIIGALALPDARSSSPSPRRGASACWHSSWRVIPLAVGVAALVPDPT